LLERIDAEHLLPSRQHAIDYELVYRGSA
jgi:hypothetical protein